LTGARQAGRYSRRSRLHQTDRVPRPLYSGGVFSSDVLDTTSLNPITAIIRFHSRVTRSAPASCSDFVTPRASFSHQQQQQQPQSGRRALMEPDRIPPSPRCTRCTARAARSPFVFNSRLRISRMLKKLLSSLFVLGILDAPSTRSVSDHIGLHAAAPQSTSRRSRPSFGR